MLSQQDVAAAAGVGHSTVFLVERGHCGHLSLATVERIAAILDIRVDVVARWRGGDLDRLLNRPHSLLAESFAARLTSAPGWAVEPEVSFSIYGERGAIDQLGWHAATAHVLVVELKTELVDVNELLGTLDRKRRLIPQIARARGMDPRLASVWLVVADTSTNRRHAREHTTLLRSRLPCEGRQSATAYRRSVFPHVRSCFLVTFQQGWSAATRAAGVGREEPGCGRGGGQAERGNRRDTRQCGAADPTPPAIPLYRHPGWWMTRERVAVGDGVKPGTEQTGAALAPAPQPLAITARARSGSASFSASADHR